MGNETATDSKSMQDIAADLESRLYPSSEGDQADQDQLEADAATDDEALDDEQDSALPDSDDSDSEDEEDSEQDLDAIAEGDDLTLAEYLGVPEERIVSDEEGNIALTAIIDGEEKQVQLKDLVTSYQLQGHVNNKSIALQEERKAFEETRNQVAAELQTRIGGIDALSKALEQELVAEFNGIDWDKLRASDPGQWSALRQDYSERAQRIQQTQELYKQQMLQLQQQQAAEMQKQIDAYANEQLEKLIIAQPKWADEAVRKADHDRISNLIQTKYGYTAKEMETVSDHRLILMMQDLEKFHNGTKAAEEKKAKRVPKFKKPGASQKQAAALAKARRVKAQRQAVKASGGKPKDVAQLIIDRM